MTVAQLQQKEKKSSSLRVFQLSLNDYYVESSRGKVCYRVVINNGQSSCTCGDYNSNIQKDPGFTCKHIIAAMRFSETDVRPRLDERFIRNIKGKDFVLYAGVLDLAHKMGLVELKASPVQYPTKENDMRAICVSYARTQDGRVFEDVGDADPNNTDSVISRHIIRMASTRAKARALRDLTNVGMACLEELADLEEVETQKETIEKNNVRPLRKPKEDKDASEKTDTQAAQTNQKKEEETKERIQKTEQQKTQTDNVMKIASAQMQAIINLAKRRGMTEEEIRTRIFEKYKVKFEDMDASDAKVLIRQLQQSA
ncbi:MAG TPA: SWIM zinc finger family protein [Syntrophorhabdaceae bacterium]|nr:SWIM zinc finger family protein [Syntrophorhabdaceae bacterium]HRR72736.1 SWIM zinc finger family protein [Syntrophorhabdaceae bacterium]HRV23505.1 SWIM zinc finger family protein [Syntrophorhabdaceae bacterium]